MAEAEAQQAVNEQQPQYKKRIESGNQCMTKQLLTILRCKP